MSREDWSDLLGRRSSRRPQGRAALLPAMPGLRGWLWGGAVALLATGAAGMASVALQEGRILPLERVELTDAPQRVAGEDLRQALVPHLHRSVLGVDVRGARDALEALPWVERAAVRRAWPGSIQVTLHEREPLARWDEHALIDRSGERFEPPVESIPEVLPELRGPEGSEGEVARLFKQMQEQLDKRHVNLVALSLSPRGSWSARLEDGVEMALGRQHPGERVERFAAVLPTLEEREEAPMERVDLRYPNGFAVAWGAADEAD
ncbi:cell division protein FtsQ/DivIB [Halorhodospira halophila]|uniref:Cell division protein FtsQ n=1 Tax=Halorhodospira halophila (strain DSM 244 / SL1) TaxID=349124 RepID=A1WYT9_HALHL|nr:cell division protein FtsQ/DivIB [Halorhodospira halophila]ABM62851.1 Polypeptide-transport-associated domain protein, FtsQ-type [Halorhodospira halophila SL1]MBK1728026.1 hypothetical protein [Halorhodospira halophila]